MSPSPTRLTVEGYDLLKVLGQGTAGTVYLARCTPTSQHVAIKLIPASKVRTTVRREVSHHLPQQHPNIMPLHAVTYAHIPHKPPSLALVMDYAPAGDMFDEVASAAPLSPRLLRRRLFDIATALHHLHQQNIAHLDVKLENVVITPSNTAQLIDFGCARRMSSKPDPDTPLGGTLQYIPPEVVEDASYPPSATSDAWALGVLAYTALSGSYPFNGASANASDAENDRFTRRRIRFSRPHRLPAAIDLPSDLRNIIYGLLEKDPAKRMTIPQVLAELQRASSVSRPRMSQRGVMAGKVTSRRPPSPSSTVDADFGGVSCTTRKQTIEEALRVVDAIQRSRARGGDEIRLYMSDLGPVHRAAEGRRARHSASATHRPHVDNRTQ
eukprot:GFKZ01007065.1.p1 GENE.GFKZ01007065.1~~GFKZ01007065.1.p1  ORF type:complete len:383 (+),score=49.29 GFKZ01007065.1:323-1471(+)